MVKLNQRNPEVQQYHFDTVRFWVEQFDIDGIRLDAADVLDFGFMQQLRGVANQVKPEFWLMGEVIHGDYSRWANPGMLHSVTNYELHKGLWSGHNDHNYFEIAHTMRRLQGLCGNTKLYNFSDNHDVDRLPEKLRQPAHIRHIAILVYTLWGVPSIYYGSEFGIHGKKERGSDWPLRPCLELADYADAVQSNPVTSVYAALGRLKAQLPVLSEGEPKELLLTTQHYAFARVLGRRSRGCSAEQLGPGGPVGVWPAGGGCRCAGSAGRLLRRTASGAGGGVGTYAGLPAPELRYAAAADPLRDLAGRE